MAVKVSEVVSAKADSIFDPANPDQATLPSADMLQRFAQQIDMMCGVSHFQAAASGWWHKVDTTVAQVEGETKQYILKPRNFGELISLMHSELSEALEAGHKGLDSDHISGYSGIEEEFADVLHRMFDCAGALGLRLGNAWVAKLIFNGQREDHKPDVRSAEGGKEF